MGISKITGERDPNNIIIKEDYALVELRNWDREVVDYAIIDLEDIELISKFTWYKTKDGYAAYSDKYKELGFGTTYIPMHSLIMNNLAGFWNTPDHIDRNRLNNRRNNLRIADRSEQQINHNKSIRNHSGVIGVSWQERRKHHWRASIKFKDKIINEYYDTKEDAIIARLKMENEMFGEYAPQKHLFEQYGIN